MQNLTINDAQLEHCKQALSGPQQRAVLEFISSNPGATTAQIAAGAGAINVPDVARKINPKLKPLGYQIVNSLPKLRPMTRHGQRSLLHVWKLVPDESTSSKER